jgi:hypothetical protein
MQFREIIATYCENHNKTHKRTLSADLGDFYGKADGTYRYYFVSRG